MERGFEAATGAEIDIDEDGGNLSIRTDEGEVSMGTSAELPDGFPDEVPLIDGEISGGMRVSEGERDGFMVTVIAQGPISDVYSQVTQRLEDAGYVESSSTDAGGLRNAMYEDKGAIIGLAVTFLEAEADGVVTVSYNVSREK